MKLVVLLRPAMDRVFEIEWLLILHFLQQRFVLTNGNFAH